MATDRYRTAASVHNLSELCVMFAISGGAVEEGVLKEGTAINLLILSILALR